MGSNYSKASVPPPTEVSEKRMIIERFEAPAPDKATVNVEEALTYDNITKWTTDLENVRLRALLGPRQQRLLVEYYARPLAIGLVPGRPGHSPCFPKDYPA